MVEYFALALYLNIVFVLFYLIKIRVLTYTTCKEYNDLYTKIQGLIAVNGCHVGLAQKDIILLSKSSLIVHKVGKRTSVTNTEFIRFALSGGTYSIDDFNAKIKMAILQQRQGWEPPKIKDLDTKRTFI